MNIAPDTTTSKKIVVGAASVAAGVTIGARERWIFTTTVACWVKQGVLPTATAGDTSTLVPAGGIVQFYGIGGPNLAVIQDTVTGNASVQRGLDI